VIKRISAGGHVAAELTVRVLVKGFIAMQCIGSNLGFNVFFFEPTDNLIPIIDKNAK